MCTDMQKLVGIKLIGKELIVVSATPTIFVPSESNSNGEMPIKCDVFGGHVAAKTMRFCTQGSLSNPIVISKTPGKVIPGEVFEIKIIKCMLNMAVSHKLTAFLDGPICLRIIRYLNILLYLILS